MGATAQELVGAHQGQIVDRLNRAIAAELNDAYRYLLLSKLAAGVHSGPVSGLFARTAEDEWGHVAMLIDRVLQLGGRPMPSPAEAAQYSYTAYRQAPKDATDLHTMLTDSLHGERAAIAFYRDLYELTRDIDPVTADIARQALIDEIGDEDDLERLLAGWPHT